MCGCGVYVMQYHTITKSQTSLPAVVILPYKLCTLKHFHIIFMFLIGKCMLCKQSVYSCICLIRPAFVCLALWALVLIAHFLRDFQCLLCCLPLLMHHDFFLDNNWFTYGVSWGQVSLEFWWIVQGQLMQLTWPMRLGSLDSLSQCTCWKHIWGRSRRYHMPRMEKCLLEHRYASSYFSKSIWCLSCMFLLQEYNKLCLHFHQITNYWSGHQFFLCHLPFELWLTILLSNQSC